MSGLGLPIPSTPNPTNPFGASQYYEFGYYHIGYDTASLAWYSGAAYADHFHAGVDWSTGDTAALCAPEDSVITFEGWVSSPYGDEGTEYGGGIVIEGKIAGGMTWVYAHCTDTAVNVGQFVKRGQIVGHEGSTGVATGPHVHAQLYTRLANGARLFWNFAEFLPGGAHAGSTLIQPHSYLTSFAGYAAKRQAAIPAHATVYGYNPNTPNKVAATFTANAYGSSFWVNGKTTVTWPTQAANIPRGTFLHGDPTYGGAFKNLLVVPGVVKPADGKPW